MKSIFQVVGSIKKDNYDAYIQEMNPAYLNALDKSNSNLLQTAISYKQDRIAEDLIERGIDVNHQNNKGLTALHLCAVHKNLSIAKKIIDNGGNVNISDSYGNNALWTATMNAKGYYDIVELYTNHDGDPKTVNNNNKSPLSFAEQIGDTELIKILR